MLQVGYVLEGRFKILKEIGRGGMSVVYMAHDMNAGNICAVKEIRRGGNVGEEVSEQRLVAEVGILKKLYHPSLPKVIDVIEYADSIIMVMEYIEGRNLENLIKHTGAQDPVEAIRWGSQLCDVLQYLHTRIPIIV